MIVCGGSREELGANDKCSSHVDTSLSIGVTHTAWTCKFINCQSGALTLSICQCTILNGSHHKTITLTRCTPIHNIYQDSIIVDYGDGGQTTLQTKESLLVRKETAVTTSLHLSPELPE